MNKKTDALIKLLPCGHSIQRTRTKASALEKAGKNAHEQECMIYKSYRESERATSKANFLAKPPESITPSTPYGIEADYRRAVDRACKQEEQGLLDNCECCDGDAETHAKYSI